MTGLATGPCRGRNVGGDVAVCPYGNEATMITFDAGLGAGAMTIRGMCERCIADDDAEEARRELDRRLERLRLIRDAPRDRGWDFDTFAALPESAEALAAARAWLHGYLAGGRGNLILHGAIGRGKTGLAWAIVKDVILVHGRNANLVNWRNLLHDIRSGFDLDSTERRESLQAYFSVPLLFLDDIGAERPSDWAVEQLSILVDERYMANKVTCITTNYTTKELAVRLSPDDDLTPGTRIVSRLIEGATRVEVAARHDRRATPV